MAAEADLDRELRNALRGPSYKELALRKLRALLEPLGIYLSIPPYQPDNQEWEITFRALNLDEKTIYKFWKLFYKMNKTGDGEVSIIEFMNFFNLDRTTYVEKAFKYCDTVGGGEMDFLEFIVSVWNMLTLNPSTLTNFTFDLYDLDDDGELSYDELETMIKELYGPKWEESGLATECLRELMLTSEKYMGAIPQDAFVRFQKHHSMLLFPAFLIQRSLQERILGVEFWEAKAKERAKPVEHGERRFDRRHVQAVLRTYKTGSAAAILTHTGDPNEGLRMWMKKKDEPVVIDHDAIKAEISKLRGEKLTKIAQWRRLKNPKMKIAWRNQLIKELKEKRAQAKIDDEKRLLVAEQEAAELQQRKSAVIKLINAGTALNEEEEFLAVEHDLRVQALAGSDFLRVLAVEEKAAEALARKEKVIEIMKIEDIRRRYFDEGDVMSQFDELEQAVVNELIATGGGEKRQEIVLRDSELDNDNENENGEDDMESIDVTSREDTNNINNELLLAKIAAVERASTESSVTANIIILPSNKKLEIGSNGRLKRPRRTHSQNNDGKFSDRQNPQTFLAIKAVQDAQDAQDKEEMNALLQFQPLEGDENSNTYSDQFRDNNNNSPGVQSERSKKSTRSNKGEKRKSRKKAVSKSHTWKNRLSMSKAKVAPL